MVKVGYFSNRLGSPQTNKSYGRYNPMKFYLQLRSRKSSSDQTYYDKYATLINGTLSIKKLIKKKNYYMPSEKKSI